MSLRPYLVSIGALPNLDEEEFMARENLLTDIPDHVERTDEAILAWLREEAKKAGLV